MNKGASERKTKQKKICSQKISLYLHHNEFKIYLPMKH